MIYESALPQMILLCLIWAVVKEEAMRERLHLYSGYNRFLIIKLKFECFLTHTVQTNSFWYGFKNINGVSKLFLCSVNSISLMCEHKFFEKRHSCVEVVQCTAQ